MALINGRECRKVDTLKTGWWNDSVQLGSSSDTEPEAQFDIRQYFEAKAAESEGSDTGARDAAALSAQWRAWHYTTTHRIQQQAIFVKPHVGFVDTLNPTA